MVDDMSPRSLLCCSLIVSVKAAFTTQDLGTQLPDVDIMPKPFLNVGGLFDCLARFWGCVSVVIIGTFSEAFM
jgi:hypothetical protein